MSSLLLSESHLLLYVDLSCLVTPLKLLFSCDATVVIHNVICCLSLALFHQVVRHSYDQKSAGQYIKLLAWKCISTVCSWKLMKKDSLGGAFADETERVSGT